MSNWTIANRTLKRVQWSITLIAAGFICQTATAADRVWQALTRDGNRISGTVQGVAARELTFQRSHEKNVDNRLPVDRLERLELPARQRILPGIGVRQFQLMNGDCLHARILPKQHPDLKARQQDLLLSGPCVAKWPLPWSGLAAVRHSPGTRCLVEFDFEESAMGWSVRSPQDEVRFDLKQFRSGQRSLKCSSEQPEIQYRLPHELTAGWIQFAFFSEACVPDTTETVFGLSFSPTHGPINGPDDGPINGSDLPKRSSETATAKPPNTFSEGVEVCLAGPTPEFDLHIPAAGSGTRQRLSRLPGWHTLTCQLTAQTVALMIDGDLLGTYQLSEGSLKALKSVEFMSGDKASPVWIDDFFILEEAPREHPHRLQYVQDEVWITSGDQLFGLVQDIRLPQVTLASGPRETQIVWPQISKIELAESAVESRPVSGLISRVELQPLWTSPDWHQADVLHGAIVEYDNKQITLDHSILGSMAIPLTDIRQLKPTFHGTRWEFAGRGVHLGDEVKSQFQRPVPQGTSWKRSFQLATTPTEAARLRVTCLNLEPSGTATRSSALLQRLQMGEFLSEISLNGKRIAVLNEHVTGHGTTEMPQEIVLKLAAGNLQQGSNSLEIMLHPSRDQVPEYDDWELLGLSLELPQAIVK